MPGDRQKLILGTPKVVSSPERGTRLAIWPLGVNTANASINEQVSSHRQGGPAADGSLFSIWGPAENFLSTSVVGGRNRVFQQCAMLPNIRPIFCCSSDAHTSGV